MIENKGDKVSNVLDFYDWGRHKRKQNHWVVQDYEVSKIPYSRARSKPSMNKVTATEWNTISSSQILFKSVPEGDLEKCIT